MYIKGFYSSCKARHVVEFGDSCRRIADTYRASFVDLIVTNREVVNSSCSNLTPGIVSTLYQYLDARGANTLYDRRYAYRTTRTWRLSPNPSLTAAFDHPFVCHASPARCRIDALGILQYVSQRGLSLVRFLLGRPVGRMSVIIKVYSTRILIRTVLCDLCN